MTYQILQGDNRQILQTLEDNSIDAIVTDPPYGINFLGKTWDADTGSLETYKECLRVLKPGGHILAFSAARTYHYLAITLEQAGFEIRDQIMWIYSSGFPKSQDIGRQIQKKLGVKEKHAKDFGAKCGFKNTFIHTGDGHNERTNDPVVNNITVVTDPEAKKWEGWGTALKPAHEPICLARKPLKQSIAKNVQQYGTGALNIDATRVPNEDGKALKGGAAKVDIYNAYANVDKSHEEVTKDEWQGSDLGRFTSNVIGEIDGYQKFFYCPKVSRKERHFGFADNIPTERQMLDAMQGYYCDSQGNRQEIAGKIVKMPHLSGTITSNAIKNEYLKFCKENNIGFDQPALSIKEMIEEMGGHLVIGKDEGNIAWLPHTGNIYTHGIKHEYLKWCKDNNKTPSNTGNNHPTVKPVELMKYLVKLITPAGGTVLDPFNGSGSTGMAATELGFDYIGCELDPEYVKISERRIAAWLSKDIEPELKTNTGFDDLFE